MAARRRYCSTDAGGAPPLATSLSWYAALKRGETDHESGDDVALSRPAGDVTRVSSRAGFGAGREASLLRAGSAPVQIDPTARRVVRRPGDSLAAGLGAAAARLSASSTRLINWSHGFPARQLRARRKTRIAADGRSAGRAHAAMARSSTGSGDGRGGSWTRRRPRSAASAIRSIARLVPPEVEIANHVHDDLAVDRLTPEREPAEQRVVADHVDRARDSPRVLVNRHDRLAREQPRRLATCRPDAAGDVGGRLRQVERGNLAPERDALLQLPQPRIVQPRPRTPAVPPGRAAAASPRTFRYSRAAGSPRAGRC